MRPTPAQIRATATANLEADYNALADETCSDGDTLIEAFAETVEPTFNHPPTRQRIILAAKVGFQYLIVRRNEMRSDNAL
jgi:hypothetical protein